MPDSGPGLVRQKYRIYGVTVESEFALSSVEPAEMAIPPEVGIFSGTPDFFERRAAALRKDCPDEEWIRYSILGDGDIYIRINQVLEAIVAADGRRVVAARLDAVEERTFEANLTNFALSTCLTLQGEECLHATVIAFDGRAMGLLGPSGAGKSTLAAHLLRKGATLVTDDMLRVTFEEDRVLAHFGPHRLKLFEDVALRLLPDAARDGSFNHLSGKVMVEPGVPAANSAPLPLQALIWLGNDPSAGGKNVSTRRLAGIEPVKVLTGSTMATRYAAPERLKRQLRFAERLARIMPIHALDYPRDYRLLDDVVRELRRAVGE